MNTTEDPRFIFPGRPKGRRAGNVPDPGGSVLISTHDLKVAGSLRDAFREVGYRVELVTPGEDLSGIQDRLLLILTGGLKSESAAAMARQPAHVPVFAMGREGEEGFQKAARVLGIREAFPFPADPREVLLVGRNLIERNRLRKITGIVGEADAVQEALERVVQFAPVDATVLLTGESGTGKELIARGIHALSPRRHNAFIAVNVAALPDTLLESELFGHEKGAFTGAIDSRRGLFELAQNGTIFLDEIGEMPLSTQTKLLRVLEEREFYRVGGERPIRVDVRVIAATNQDLRRLAETGEFRRDLYFRLNVLHIPLPPLRERRGDIRLLVENFVQEASARHHRPRVEISKEAMRILEAHNWPGNVRELKNLVESMVVLAPGSLIEAQDIPNEIRNPRSRGLLPAPLFGSPLPSRRESAGGVRPELEFIFRTLVNLRMDVDDLRSDFEQFKEHHYVPGRDLSLYRPAEILPAVSPSAPFFHEPDRGRERDAGAAEAARDLSPGSWEGPEEELGGEDTSRGDREAVGEDEERIVYRPGMTLDEMEEMAIRAALAEVGGNRRKAAEQLGMGERTLYRKIKKFGLE
jgi:DNA-binding NtrC family response regulator